MIKSNSTDISEINIILSILMLLVFGAGAMVCIDIFCVFNFSP